MNYQTISDRFRGRPWGIVGEFIGIVLLSALFSVCLTYPLIFKMNDHAIDLGDTRLNAYIHSWVAHALAKQPGNLFDANMFYPAKNTLALSENMVGDQPFFAIVYGLTGNPILALNVVLLLSFELSALAMYLLVRSWTRSVWAGSVAAIIYAFAPARLGQLGHLHLLTTQWIPLIIFFLWRFLTSEKMLDLFAVTGFALLQILYSLQAGCLAALAAFAFLLGTILARRVVLNFRIAAQMFVAAILLLVLLTPILYHYKQIARSDGDLQFTVAASADPLGSYLYGAGRIYGHLSEHHMSGDFGWEKKLFPGFLVLGLAGFGVAFAVWDSIKSRSDRKRQILPLGVTISAMFVVALSYMLSLGPYLRIHDRATSVRMPFFWLRHWVPGLAIFRVPARFGMLLPFGLAILAASGFCVFLRVLERWEPLKRSSWKAVMTAGVLIVLALEFNSAPVPLAPVMVPSDVPPEYRWLAKQPVEFPLLELPITLRGNFPDLLQETGYMYASIFHWHPLVNGYSGYSPPTAVEMFHLARQLPSLDSSTKLSSLGVHYVVLHRDSLSLDELSRWTPQAVAVAQLRPVRQFGDAIIYELPLRD